MRNILVTGVGALIGQGILQALNKSVDRSNLHIVGIDKNENTHACYICDKFVKKPCLEESSSGYFNFWHSLIHEYDIDLILPGIEDDVIFLNKDRQSKNSIAFPALLNSSKILSLGLDKLVLSDFASKNNIRAIPTALASNSQAIEKLDLIERKIILKPRASNGSRGIYKFEGSEELNKFLEKFSINELDGYIIQPFIGSDTEEYTASIFGFGDGTYLGPITFKRFLAKEGYTKYAKTVESSDEIVLTIDAISEVCMPFGPTNFQFRKEDNRFLLMEINPRFSSTTSVKAAFGFDEVHMAMRFLFNGERNFNLSIAKGEAWRYTCDFIKYE